MTKPKIALQLWSIQEDCKTNLFDALKTVKQNGYDGVEFAGYHGHSAVQRNAGAVGFGGRGFPYPV